MRKFFIPCLMMAMAGCTTISSFQYPAVRWLNDNDNAPIPVPKKKRVTTHSQTKFGQISKNTEDVLAFAQSTAAMPRSMVLAGRLESVNYNNFDEVADSSWFTNRIGRTSRFENNFKTPPSMKGKWFVVANDSSDKPQEFVIEDAHHNAYVVKIDADPDYLVSGGEMLGALVLSAAGYNVTENYIVDFNSAMLSKPILPPGNYHGLALKIPEGEQLGPFQFEGRRSDDPNDRISHEYRRELCALRVFASFLNNKDISTRNTLDMYDNGHVIHYLSNLLGPLANLRSEFLSGSTRSETHTIDALFSFGLYNPYWTSSDTLTEYKGILSSDKFSPQKWQPNKPNLAFKFMSHRDAFWAAKILQKFTDDDLRAIVAMSGYKDSATRERIVNEMIVRRDRIVVYWFSKVNALDNFALNDNLTFDDIGVPKGVKYRYHIRNEKRREFGKWQEISEPSIPIPDAITETIVVQIQTLLDPKLQKWSPSVDVYIENKNGPTILGIYRRYFH